VRTSPGSDGGAGGLLTAPIGDPMFPALSGSQAIIGRFGDWDVLLLAAADAARGTVMLGEDMDDGLGSRGLEVVNPFGPHGPGDRVRKLLNL